MRTEFLCISVLRVSSGHRVKLVGCKSALNTSVVCSIDRSNAAVLVLFLRFVALCSFVVLALFSVVVFFSICVVMLTLWSPSSIAAHVALFINCVMMLAQQLPILLFVLLVVIKSGIRTLYEVICFKFCLVLFCSCVFQSF